MLARGSHICSTTLTSARQGGGRERLYAATRGKAGKRLAFGFTLCNSLHESFEYIPHNQ